jgi:hypothetical protein
MPSYPEQCTVAGNHYHRFGTSVAGARDEQVAATIPYVLCFAAQSLHQVVYAIPFHVIWLRSALFIRGKWLSAGSHETPLDKMPKKRNRKN